MPSPPPSIPHHFPDPRLSCWQSAVAQTFANKAEAASTASRAARSGPHIIAAAKAADATSGSAPVGVLNDIERCARCALELGLAKISGDQVRARALEAEFEQYGDCDPRWRECTEQFQSYYEQARKTKAYRQWRNLGDFVFPLPERCRIGVIGDWGTGQERAVALLHDLAARKPDILIHLGDIYYACMESEARLFEQDCREAFDGRPPRVFSMCGNHDMYSGGAPYQGLVDRLYQGASFFCLRNAHWQILAGDTGYNDFDPSTRGTKASAVQHHDNGDSYSELTWHKDKFASANGRRTILLTHHQPFTRNSPIEGRATNESLLGQFGPYLDRVALWLWGHEHNQVIYAAFRGVEKGRCIGASAVPTPASQALYDVPPALGGQNVPALLNNTPNLRLSVDNELGLYNLGYATLELNGPELAASYFQFDSTRRQSTKMHEESVKIDNSFGSDWVRRLAPALFRYLGR